MRFSKLFSVAFVLMAFTVVAGCGGGGGQDTQTTDQSATQSQSSATGSLVATVNFDGEAPEPKEVDASGNSECGVDTIEQQTVAVNDNGTLKNAVVAVQSGPSGLDKDVEAPTIDQDNCQYKPHVEVMKSGQRLTVTDSDEGLHNVRGSRDGRQLFNKQTFKGQTKEMEIGNGGIVSLQCDVHPWMQSYVYMTENGAADVTGNEGTVSLSDLPTGDYTLEIWHEEYGNKTVDVTINEDEEASVEVTYSA